MNAKLYFKRALPEPLWMAVKSARRGLTVSGRRALEALGYTVARKQDYYSPLPSEFDLRRNRARWARPSSMPGVRVDLEAQKVLFTALVRDYLSEFAALLPYEQAVAEGFGPGFPKLDAMGLYAMLRKHKPRHYVEVGSGLSTYYASLAAPRNADEGHPMELYCVEPHPYARLRALPDLHLTQDQVQNVPLEYFDVLEPGDVLFIDSSHTLKIDGDVPFLFLEVVPRLKPGVLIHVHDIPFPYNVPYPTGQWVLGEQDYSPYWPMYWNEAMLVQALLCFSRGLEVLLSTPLLRHHDEAFVKAIIPDYESIDEQPNTYSSLWLRRIEG